MLIKSIKKCKYFQVPDETILCEILHPKNEKIDMGCSIAHAYLESGKSSLPHRLKTSTEVYYILNGSGRMHVDEEEEIISSGQVVYIPPGSEQWIENVGDDDLLFLVVVSPPWQEEDEEIFEWENND